MDKVEQPLYWPAKMLDHIQQEATRLDVSMSWCVQLAWKHARKELTQLGMVEDHPGAEAIYEARFDSDEKRKQTLFFPSEMLIEIQGEATRQDRSLSWLMQRAWCLAADSIAARTPETNR